MKQLALIAGVAFLLLAIAGFAGMLALPPMYNAVLAAAGVMFMLYGATNHRAMVPPHVSGHDLRDLGDF